MTAYQIANSWVEDKAKYPLIDPHLSANYSPMPLEKESSTGTRESERFIEALITNCGSGSWCDAVLSQLKKSVIRDSFSGDWTVIFLAPEEKTEKILPPTIAEKLDEIRNAFGLSMAALAGLLKTSRASMYNWYEKEPRSAEVVQRLDTLYGIAREWVSKNPYHFAPGRLMKQKLDNSPSMLDRLSRENPDLDEIRDGMDSLLALMKKQRERMDRAKARSAKTPIDTESHKELLERLTGSVTAKK